MDISFCIPYQVQPPYPNHLQFFPPNNQVVYKPQIQDDKRYIAYHNARKHINSVRSELRSFLQWLCPLAFYSVHKCYRTSYL